MRTTNTAAIADTTATDTKPARTIGTSNLATTIRSHRARYAVVQTPTGKTTANNGDWVAATLLRVPQPLLEAFVHGHFGRSYDALNNGHRRMCCGNLVRAAAKKNDAGVLEFLAQHSSE
jgi:hypothetical protein